jgi:hypothetical protein
MYLLPIQNLCILTYMLKMTARIQYLKWFIERIGRKNRFVELPLTVSGDFHFLITIAFLCKHLVNPLKPTGYVMHQQVLTFNNRTFCPHCIYMFCIYLRTNSELCHLHRKLIGFYNRDEKCLQRGTNWVFK